MNPEATLQTFQFDDYKVQAYVPDALLLQQWFLEQQKINPSLPSPYWAQVWPAARALCSFLAEQPHWIQHKKVLELASGLGLPSLLAAEFAHEVICSDYITEAVELIQRSIEYNGFQNMQSRVLDWNALPPGITADVLLVSDINYEPAVFETVYNVLKSFLNAGTVILLSTPQRLMAKPFIERLIPFCALQKEIHVTEPLPATICTIMLLKK